MNVSLEVEVELPASRRSVWDWITDIEQMPSFVGYGPIPGIASARWIRGEGPALGAVREIRNRDGSTHREEIVAFQPEQRIEDRIHAFDSPVRWLLTEMLDSFELCDAGGGTRLKRRVVFELRSALLWPLALVLRALFRRALAQHHARMAASLRPHRA